jgi:hypothetical protein
VFPAANDWGGIMAMTRCCNVGLVAALLAAGPAWADVLDGNGVRTETHGRGERAEIGPSKTRLAFDGPASLLPGVPMPQGRSCIVGERVTARGTIQDVMRQRGRWSAGAIARVDDCQGLTDLATGFAALFGDGKPPPGCEHGSRFLASGTARSGFEPEFFLKVESIKCE